MVTSAVIFSIILVLLLLPVGMAVYAFVADAVEGLVALVRQRRGSPSLTARQDADPGLSADDLWHRMQGTSKRPRRRGRTSA